MTNRPARSAVVFLCNHNAYRSHMAMAFFKHLAGDRATIYLGGSKPGDQVNTAAVAAMAERRIDITQSNPNAGRTRW